MENPIEQEIAVDTAQSNGETAANRTQEEATTAEQTEQPSEVVNAAPEPDLVQEAVAVSGPKKECVEAIPEVLTETEKMDTSDNTAENMPCIEELVSVEANESVILDDAHPIIEEPTEVQQYVEETSTAHEELHIEEVATEQLADIATVEVQLQDPGTDVEEASTEVEGEVDTSSETEEMILEETTGEYVLASSVQPARKKPKIEMEDRTVAELIEENFKAGDLQPGEQIVVLTTDDKGNTKKVVLTHTETTNDNGVTVQHVVDENGEVYLIETVDSDDEQPPEEDDEEEVEHRQQRIRKKSAKKIPIPNHVLGRNIINPAVDSSRNGKAPPKPRLGVKVPYRNLTSQIVSKQEIAEEILERSRRFSRNHPYGQNMFAKKLTQNLTKKLTGKKELPRTRGRPRKEIQNNSDLLAILEGDAESRESNTPAVAEAIVEEKQELTPEMERQMALKQLRELPDDPIPERTETKPETRTSKRTGADPPKARFGGNVPLKTYSRKPKTSEELLQQVNIKPAVSKQDNPITTPETSKPKTPITSPPSTDTTYVTKSSRIIKRKVIWDPDEVSPKKTIKIEPTKAEEKKAEKSEAKKDEHVVKERVEARRPAILAKSPVRVVKKPAEEKEKPKEKPKIKVEVSQPEETEQAEDDATENANDNEKDAAEEKKEEKTKSPPKEKPSTPVKRRTNEITKLLQDEGAVNMLYSIKNEDAPATRSSKSLQSKADELLNELTDMHAGKSDRASPKALRRKEVAIPASPAPKASKKIMQPPTPSAVSRQKSKDSNRSSVHSPPASPGASFGGSESLIIRRHSSSSYSSMGEDEDGEVKRVKKTDGRGRRRVEQGATAESAKKKKEDAKAAKAKAETFEKLVEIKLKELAKYNKYKGFVVNSLNKLVQIHLKSEEDNNVYLTNEIMSEMMTLLPDLEKDKDVNVVLLTTGGSGFCNGINFKTLVIAKEGPRKTAAKKLSTNIKDFLLCLAKFPKVLAAGIHGDSIGLGVTILPLFDMVLADPHATFTIPHAKLGCVAEGGSLLLLPHLSRNVLVNELLYSSQALSSEEALKLGLVTKILPTETFERDLLAHVKGVSDKSAQFMVATKKQLRKGMISDITNSLKDETDNMPGQWTSDECQKNFAEYYDTD